MKNPEQITQIFVVLICLIVLLVSVCVYKLSKMPSREHVVEDMRLNYCEMVALHKADPKLGWPDYKHIYDKECDE